ncbi:UDP-N-acetylglucosamine 2-epimerase [Leptospira perdikensis]|uniref:UDP-N-acetylglucosamine 2-epimerase (Hydrolyzing) n=1 Tax=Leptospira perdikensis TaxID=2484948 RepID=A0A4R9JKG3_9LEPT|nr:UDP-N-acetylglucosamine 2-epimerase [Leptospira perdikensis]TGL45986.1 UDP-N-acetylglucosamine 2-epimerase (hydrolyzing) [Leptospira perdikensis]
MTKICVITGTRAEYGLLKGLMKLLQSSSSFNLQVIATGMHLSPEFGLTYKEIEKDGFNIDRKIEILLSSDSPTSISKSMGLAMISISEALEQLKPDLLILLGDRFEIFACASCAMIARIPIAHLHGGERTEGLIDEAIRHSVTKMSLLHFVATEEYRKRVVQLGEDEERVFNCGGLGVDLIKNINLMKKDELEKSLNFQFKNKNLLVTFHPVTLENNTSEFQFKEICKVLSNYVSKGNGVIFTKANSDTDGRIINKIIDEFVSNNGNCVAFESLGALRYLSVLQYIDGVLGNSSSGLLEVPSFQKGTINVGERQKGRVMAESVIQCESDEISISKAVETLYSVEFQNKLKQVTSPYGNGGASAEIFKILQGIDFQKISVKKPFRDLLLFI